MQGEGITMMSDDFGVFDKGARNLIGISDEVHNLKELSLLMNLLKTGYRQGILCNHHTHPSLKGFEGDEKKEDEHTIRVG
mmetsp:Transcript_13959/g.25443  ORF Transcript_13959/g.25443 Transcript_13959/m.25443 type:complete len:80 (+) Transcript_13959:747-986(+)